ncbi:MAG: NTF2 fold immunity protein, partial [Flavobacteriaceae bacterium]
MKNRNVFVLIIIILCFSNFSCAQKFDEKKDFLGKEYAKNQLDEVLSENKGHNIIKSDFEVLNNTETLIKVIEPILFDIYGKENIERQKPYEINDFENHYVVNGTLKENYIGGTFLIIIDKRN